MTQGEPPSGLSVSSSQWRWSSVHDQYKTIEILGQGTYGVVYKAEHKATGELVAMKRCRLDAFREFGIPETTLREIALLRDLRHENIMTLYHVSCNTERLYLICEYLELDLKKYIRARPRGIPVRKVKAIVYELFKGLAFCHGHRVIHRDLKPHNVLVSSDLSKVKIGDFGLARSALAPGKTLTHEVITLWYRAPELLLGHCNYTSGVDVWSLGCIIAELLSLKPLYVGDSEIDTLFKIFRLLGTPKQQDWPQYAVVSWDDFPKFSGQTDPFDNLVTGGLDVDGNDLLTRIFKFNPAERISALEALNHPWLEEVRVQATNAGEEPMKPEWWDWTNNVELSYENGIPIDNKSSVPVTTATVPVTTATVPATTATVPATTATVPATTATVPVTTATVPVTTATVPATTATVDYLEDKNVDGAMEEEKAEDDLSCVEEKKIWTMSNNDECQVRGQNENGTEEETMAAAPQPIGVKQQLQYHQDVAKMAQRMKELEKKLREVERLRIVNGTTNERENDIAMKQQINKSDLSTAAPSRPTTGTSSSMMSKQQKSNVSSQNIDEGSEGEEIQNDGIENPQELSSTRRHKFGWRRKTIEADEVLVKEQQQRQQPQRQQSLRQQPQQQKQQPQQQQQQPQQQQQQQQQQQRVRPATRWGIKASIIANNNNTEANVKGNPNNKIVTSNSAGKTKTTVEIMDRLRRSSLGNFIEQRRRKKDQKVEVRGHESTNMKRNVEVQSQDVKPKDVKQMIGAGNDRYPSSLLHEYSIDSTSLESGINRPLFHNPQSTTMKSVLQPSQRNNPYKNNQLSSRPSSSLFYRKENPAGGNRHSLPPPPSSSTNWRQQKQQPPQQQHPSHWDHRLDGGQYCDPYENQRQYQGQQPQRRFNKHQQNSELSHQYRFGNPNHHELDQPINVMGRIQENRICETSSILRHSLPTSIDGYYNYIPSINNSTSSAHDQNSSFEETERTNNPSVSNSNSSFSCKKNLSLDVECSFNWTTNEQDNHRPSFQPSMYQGMMYASSGTRDGWKRSSSYGGSGVKESIARLNLKLAANASSTVPTFSDNRHRMSDLISSQQKINHQCHLPGNRSIRRYDFDEIYSHEPSSRILFYDEDSILRQSTNQNSFSDLRRQHSNNKMSSLFRPSRLSYPSQDLSRESFSNDLNKHCYYNPYDHHQTIKISNIHKR